MPPKKKAAAADGEGKAKGGKGKKEPEAVVPVNEAEEAERKVTEAVSRQQ
jgi:hypothetical protein